MVQELVQVLGVLSGEQREVTDGLCPSRQGPPWAPKAGGPRDAAGTRSQEKGARPAVPGQGGAGSRFGQPHLAAGAWFQKGLIAGDPDGLFIVACPAGRRGAGSLCVVSQSWTGALRMRPNSCCLPGQGEKGRIVNRRSPVPRSPLHPRQDTQPPSSSEQRGLPRAHGGQGRPVRISRPHLQPSPDSFTRAPAASPAPCWAQGRALLCSARSRRAMAGAGGLGRREESCQGAGCLGRSRGRAEVGRG